MTSSPDLIHELRASRPSAPAELRFRIRKLAAEPSARTRKLGWRSPLRRGALIAVPAAAALAIVAAGVIGLTRPEGPGTESHAQRSAAPELAPTTKAPAVPAPTYGAADAATPRAQRVSATLTVEVKDSDAVSRAAQDALELTRSLGGYV